MLPYFLTVYDGCFATRSQGILCQGRGSAANSTVCYCLGITSVDPNSICCFERFISAAHVSLPDIDVDFEHEKEGGSDQYIYRKYGRERAAIAVRLPSSIRGALRDVGKAMGLSVDTINRLSGTVWNSMVERMVRNSCRREDWMRDHLCKTLELTRAHGFPGSWVSIRAGLSLGPPI